MTDESAELLHELRVLCARLPVPQPTWHPYVPMILSCREDFEYALALAAERPEVILRATALVEETSEPTLDPGASPELAAHTNASARCPTPTANTRSSTRSSRRSRRCESCSSR